jgi:hypothetical protein
MFVVLPAAASIGPLPKTDPQPTVQLQGRAPIVLQRLGEQFGVKVAVDPDLPARRIELDLRDVDFAGALRVAAALVGAFWITQPDGSVLVARDTPDARELYLQPEIRTLAFPGATPEELNEAVRLLRDLLDMRRIRTDTRSGTISIQDTPYRLAVAEQLLAQLPNDPGEIVLEVQVLEVNRNRALDLGLLPPDQAFIVHLGAGALALRDPDTDTLADVLQFLLDRGLIPEALTEAALQSVISAGITDPSQLGAVVPPFILFGGGQTLFAANLPGTALQLSKLASVAQSWRRFTLRTAVDQEGRLFLGERFPIVTTTFSVIFLPAILQELIRRGQFLPPVPAVQYQDLGITIRATPHLHPDREITLTLALEQLALTGQELNSIPVISSRSLEHQVRLKDGETLMLAGIRQTTEQKTKSATPGLGSVPGLGSLFRTQPSTQTSEVIFLVTPRLTRLPAQQRLALRTFYVGTEDDFAPVGRQPAAPPPPAARPPGRPPQQPQRPQQPPQQLPPGIRPPAQQQPPQQRPQ